MKTKVTGWMVGGMALLFGSAAGAAEMAADPMDSGPSAAGASAPACRDIGITVSFDSGSYALDTNGKGALNGVAQWMAAKESRTLKVAGHTDISGDPGSNQTLSDKRADVVKDYLLQHGVDGSRIGAVGRGEEISGALPASGRTVTFIGCDKTAVAQQEPARPRRRRNRRRRPSPSCRPRCRSLRCRRAGDGRRYASGQARVRLAGGIRVPLRRRLHGLHQPAAA